MTAADCVAQTTPFLQRYCLLRFVCGERSGGVDGAIFLARELERLGPLDVREAEAVIAGWESA